MKVYIIAEAGVNHNGSLELAFALADAAKAVGADCIKFQTFKAENLVSSHAETAAYQKKQTGMSSQWEMLKKLELSYREFLELKAYCDRIGICFLSTPFDFDSIRFLSSVKMPFWKIPSGDVTNLPYLVALAKTGSPIVMSTGMCSIDEIQDAVNVLKENGAGKITLLHCSTEYPTPFEDVNLLAMNTLRDTFGTDVGYSDHTKGIEVPVAAAALGACVIEKHLTLDRSMEGPDHKASLEPDEFKKMVEAIRHIEVALGSPEKHSTEAERKNIKAARKSIVAKTAIKKGEMFTENNITVKRPGNGISPMRWYEVLGRLSTRDFRSDELIEL